MAAYVMQQQLIKDKFLCKKRQ